MPAEWYFMALDSIFLCIYVVEAVLKITALGFKYFSDPWNNLGGWGWGVCGWVGVVGSHWTAGRG